MFFSWSGPQLKELIAIIMNEAGQLIENIFIETACAPALKFLIDLKRLPLFHRTKTPHQRLAFYRLQVLIGYGHGNLTPKWTLLLFLQTATTDGTHVQVDI